MHRIMGPLVLQNLGVARRYFMFTFIIDLYMSFQTIQYIALLEFLNQLELKSVWQKISPGAMKAESLHDKIYKIKAQNFC